MFTPQTKYLVFDIETVVDGRLVQKVRYPQETQLSPAQAVTKYKEELLADGKSDFIPQTFHVPVSVAIAKVAQNFELLDVVTLDRPKFRPQVITKHFWEGWRKYDKPTLITFNGRGFDIPVLEMAAFRYGLELSDWFSMDGANYKWPRYRFNFDKHFDLQELLTNFGSTNLAGGLNLCATLLNKPGKMDTKGAMVQELWDKGEKLRIDNYCICDALDTYFVFLRTRVVAGQLSLRDEHLLVEKARQWIEAASAQNPALQEYLSHFNFWKPYGEDEAGFLK